MKKRVLFLLFSIVLISTLLSFSCKKDEPTANDNSETVYVTDTGSKYHRSTCQYLDQTKRAISLNDAKKQGYTPCSVCNPPK
jgi:hypothetical protein